jgi:hypothetical protein
VNVSLPEAGATIGVAAWAGGGKEGVTIAGGLIGETVCVGGKAGGTVGVTVGALPVSETGCC